MCALWSEWLLNPEIMTAAEIAHDLQILINQSIELSQQ